jgi:hypothetical protein
MLILVQLDISEADMALFEAYENQALAILGNHGDSFSNGCARQMERGKYICCTSLTVAPSMLSALIRPEQRCRSCGSDVAPHPLLRRSSACASRSARASQ